MKNRKILLNIVVYSGILASICACGASNPSDKPVVSKIVDASTNKAIWGTFGSEKIVQDRARSYYSSKDQEANISILTCKDESELDQIVVSPESKINYFDARVADLTSEDGTILAKENIDLLAAKYLKIDSIYDIATNESKGNFPDALIPVSAIVIEKTNYIEAGYNQSFYIKVNTPKNQKAGIYTGSLFIQLDNIEYKVNITVEVMDYVISSVTHSKSLFLNDWQFESGENDSSQDKLDAYNNALLKYRLSPDKIIKQEDMYSKYDSDFIYRYTEKAYEFMQNDHCTNVSIPYNVISLVENNEWYQNIDAKQFKELLVNYYIKSIATNYNMFNKSNFYCGIIDEPDDRQILRQTTIVIDTFNECINDVVEDLSMHGYLNHPMHHELVESIKNINNIVTCAYSDIYAPYIECWCPKANFYNTVEQRANYANQREKWWYTCVYPRAPYPTYHIEDGLTSSRALSWMQAEYDVVGNLFWATNVYARYNGQQYIPIEDYYHEGYRFTGVNGDGFLFYPGEPLGSKEPFASNRLESIRDGLEEYELFYDLKQEYEKYSFDDQPLFNLLNKSLYRGTKVIGGTSEMEEARKDLLDVLLANKNGSEFLISKCEYNESLGQVELEFFAKNNTEIKFNGTTLSSSQDYLGGKIYPAILKLENEKNVGTIEISNNGKTNTIVHNFGGKVIKYDANKLVNGFSKYNADVTSSIVTLQDEELVKINVDSILNKKQSIKYTPSFLKDINSGTKLLTLRFKNIFDEDIKVSLGAKFKNSIADQYLLQDVILPANESYDVEVDMSTMSLDSLGSIEYLLFIFGDDTKEGYKPEVEVYLKDVVISY